jgi:hypothetical protein
MMTVITHVAVKEGSEPEWEAFMRDLLEAVGVRWFWV